MNTLVGAGSAQRSLQLHLLLLLLVQSSHRNLGIRHEGRDHMLITVHTDDFLCDILIALHVLTVCRNLQGQLVALDGRSELQILHDMKNLFIWNLNAENVVDTADAHLQRSGLCGISRVDIHMRRGNLAAAKLLDQMQRTLHRVDRGIFVNTLLVLRTCIRALSEGT